VTILERSSDEQAVFAVSSDGSVTKLASDASSTIRQWSSDHEHSIYAVQPLSDGGILTGGGNGTLAARDGLGNRQGFLKIGKNAVRAIAVDDFGRFHCATDDGELITL
jgi:hypothetical protein